MILLYAINDVYTTGSFFYRESATLFKLIDPAVPSRYKSMQRGIQVRVAKCDRRIIKLRQSLDWIQFDSALLQHCNADQ